MAANRHACAIDQGSIVFDEAFERFPTEVQPVEVGVPTLEICHDSQRLRVVIKAAKSRKRFIERALTGMTEWRMAEIVGERQRFGEVLVQSECTRERTGNLRDLKRVRQSRAIVIALVIDEDLRFVRQPAKGSGVDDSVAVAPEGIAARACRLIVAPAPALRRIGGINGPFSPGIDHHCAH
jgi:hypothetical protein